MTLAVVDPSRAPVPHAVTAEPDGGVASGRARRAANSAGWSVLAVDLVAMVGVAIGSRTTLAQQGIRLDEAQSLWQTDHSFPALLRIVTGDVHVPLYHLLLRTWRLALGSDIETARLLSLVFLLASIPVFHRIARRCLTAGWAAFAVVVFSCSPFLLWYGSEARMYSLMVLITLLNQSTFLRILDGAGAGNWVGYTLSAVVGVYTHYFFALVLLTQALYLLAVSRRRLRSLGALTVVAVVVLAAFGPWLRVFTSSGAGLEMRPNLATPTSVDLSNVFAQFLFGYPNDAVNTAVVSTWPLLVLAALASVRAGGSGGRRIGYLIAASFVPVLLAFGLSQVGTPAFLSRYLAFVVPALLLLVVRFISTLGRPVARSLAAVLLALVGGATVLQVLDPNTPVREDYRSAAALAEQARPQDLVVLSSPFSVYPFEYYYDGSARVTTLPRWDRRESLPAFDAARLPADVAALLPGHQYIYLVLSYDQGYEDDVFQYFEHHYEQTAEHHLSPGLRLLVYRVGYSEAVPVGDASPEGSS